MKEKRSEDYPHGYVLVNGRKVDLTEFYKDPAKYNEAPIPEDLLEWAREIQNRKPVPL